MHLQKFNKLCDLNFLYEVMPEECKEHSLNSDVDFDNWLNRELSTFYHIFYMLYENETPIGYICTYDYRVLDAHCKIKFHVERETLKDFYSTISNFINAIFREYPLNKIFYLSDATYEDRHEFMMKIGFEDEIILKDYLFKNGYYRDVFVMSLSRKTEVGECDYVSI